MVFEFGEGQLYGIEVRAVGRQEQEPASCSLDRLSGRFDFVSGEVVEDDDSSGLELWGQNFLDVSGKSLTIHGSRDDPWGN